MTKSLHPHWHATDGAEPVPVRAAAPSQAAHRVRVGPSSVSRRPAAVVGILLVLTIGAVGWGTWSGADLPTTAEVTAPERTYFDVLSEQITEQVNLQASVTSPEASGAPVPSRRLTTAIPTNPHAAGRGPSAAENTNTISADVLERLHSGAPLPPGQPETGAGTLFATIAGALGLLYVRTRGILRG
jgi:hypothetical protein